MTPTSHTWRALKTHQGPETPHPLYLVSVRLHGRLSSWGEKAKDTDPGTPTWQAERGQTCPSASPCGYLSGTGKQMQRAQSMASREDAGGTDSGLTCWLVLLLLGEPGGQLALGPSHPGVALSLLFPPQLTTRSVTPRSLINQEK